MVEFLKKLTENAKLSEEDIKTLDELQENILNNDYQQSTKKKYNNPLARRMESELPIILLTNPTKSMMESVKRVSDEILKLIEDLGEDFNSKLAIFDEDSHVIALGALKKPTADDIKKILTENDPSKLAEIMHIHFKFAQNITREVPIKNAPKREPVGKLALIIKQKWPENDVKDFFTKGIASDSNDLGEKGSGREYRAYISDEVMYNSPLYTAVKGRGRKVYFNPKRTNQLGLMRRGQEEYEKDFPMHPSQWASDCKCQPPNLNSPYVLDLVNNDAVYVAGPSGMTSILLGQMEVLANLESEELKKNYLSAIVSYIVGGGFHSLHEVIGPAEYALGLVPGYHVEVPQQDKVAPPPNYHQFFAQQVQIDPEFKDRREQAWTNYIQYFGKNYAPQKLSEVTQEKSLLPLDNLSLINTDIPWTRNSDKKAILLKGDLESLNKLIAGYNQLTKNDKQQQIRELRQIYHFNQYISNKYPPELFSENPGLNKEIQFTLFNQLKNEFKSFGVRSLDKNCIAEVEFVKTKEFIYNVLNNKNKCDDFFKRCPTNDVNIQKMVQNLDSKNPVQFYADLCQLQRLIRNDLSKFPVDNQIWLKRLLMGVNFKIRDLKENRPSFADMIANMDPKKVSKLTKILFAGSSFNLEKLKNLYSPSEDGYGDYQQFRQTHSMTFLGGNNSKNFKIEPILGGEPFVLKVDNRLATPKNIEVQLTENVLGDVITTVYAERSATFENFDTSEQITRGLVITEFCTGGDLQSHAERDMTDDERISSAINIYKQQASILEKIRQDGCFFPDIKNTNWLLDHDGKVKIADTKSFLPAKKGRYERNSEEMVLFEHMLTTPYMNPVEVSAKLSSYNVDPVHAYMLGINLYRYLTKCPAKDLPQASLLTNEHFSHPIFQTKAGMQLQLLILNLTHLLPNERLSVAKAIQSLTQVESLLTENNKKVETTTGIITGNTKQSCMDVKSQLHKIKNQENPNVDTLTYSK